MAQVPASGGQTTAPHSGGTSQPNSRLSVNIELLVFVATPLRRQDDDLQSGTTGKFPCPAESKTQRVWESCLRGSIPCSNDGNKSCLLILCDEWLRSKWPADQTGCTSARAQPAT